MATTPTPVPDAPPASRPVTVLLDAAVRGEPGAADRLLPAVYDELRKLAAARLAREAPGQTLQATALVHEAYLRLVGTDRGKPWDGRGHFFAAAAEAMRRILVENARARLRVKRGGDRDRLPFDPDRIVAPDLPAEVLALDEALTRLAALDAQAARVVELRFFAGLTVREAAAALGVSPRTVDHAWAYARAWLLAEVRGADD